jgi:hypothetical protein
MLTGGRNWPEFVWLAMALYADPFYHVFVDVPAFGPMSPSVVVEMLGRKGLPKDDLAGAIKPFQEKVSIGSMMSSPGLLSSFWADLGDFGTAITTTRFRILVDEWIDTGLGPDGAEDPALRHLARTSVALAAVEMCAARTPLRLAFDPELSVLRPQLGELPLGTLSLPRYPFSHQRAVNEADELFTRLMVSQWKDLLFKCRYAPCGRYLIEAPRRPRKNGFFCCPEHQRRASAGARRDSLRRGAKIILIEAAAQQLAERGVTSQQWQHDATLKQQLAGKLCFVIAEKTTPGYRDEVKANWVTRHVPEIEMRRLELVRDGGRASPSSTPKRP